jgi:predicted dehydrogenase
VVFTDAKDTAWAANWLRSPRQAEKVSADRRRIDRLNRLGAEDDEMTSMSEPGDVSRRRFLASGAAAAALAAIAPRAFAAGADVLKFGLIGCGGRGNGAVDNLFEAAEAAKMPVKLVALGDLFQDRLDGTRNTYTHYTKHQAQVDLPPERCFAGFEAYQKVIDCGLDYVLLATPPGFRPLHLKYAVEKGKHVFFEKPCAVDPTGARSVIETAALAAKNKTGLVAGTLYRHGPCYRETVGRIHDGAIGNITAGQVYYNTGELWYHPRQPAWSDSEYQLRNWYYFTWLSGDHNVEQHVHNLDVLHWVMGGPPLRCTAIGGRQVRTDPAYGCIYDHFVTDYEYPDDVHIMSMCRQQNGTTPKNTNHYIGTKGHSDPSNWIKGDNPYQFPNPQPFAGYVLEHQHFLESIAKGEPLNEGQQMAESTLMGVMARMSAYTGKEVTWEFVRNKSKLDLSPPEWHDGPGFGPMATPAVAIPGRVPLV